MRREFSDLRIGDVVRAQRAGDSCPHVWVLMSDVKFYTKCVRACNFTSSNRALDSVYINVSGFKLPSHWFKNPKETTFLRLNDVDCISQDDEIEYLGNLAECCVELMKHICLHTYSCSVTGVDDLCECDFGRIKEEISAKMITLPECGCVTSVL